MLVWALLSSAVAHGLGWVGQRVLRLEHWTILAAGRANSNALPLLLLESLKTTGVLDVFEMEGSDTLQRARTIVLLNSIVQEIITFALGPRILHLDSKKPTPPPTPASSSEVLCPGVPPHALGLPTIQDHEHVGLLGDVSDASCDEDGDDDGHEERTIRKQVDIMSGAAPHAIPSKAARLLGLERAQKSTPGKTLGRGLGKTWEAAKVWMNPALVGGLIALILGGSASPGGA
ncbi:hypothetical protein FIBSPDRAFT_868274 [Athelia psychrophila]|uniref:Uncharacterized protein n=2 Tax=Athelia psychrophila TaxID=1759441 RepID=A0A166D951_9AGAM|nr:hypothetical protein FIBSPDRAFT_868274 [Fibularhizoctonia sp. CBS 109695]